MSSARKELFEAFKPWNRRPGPDEVNRLINNFAHELAEEKRAKAAGEGAVVLSLLEAALSPTEPKEEARYHRSEIVSALRACAWEKREVAEALDSVEQEAVRAALSHAAHELRQDAGLREAEEETALAAYGRELADLIDPSVVDR